LGPVREIGKRKNKKAEQKSKSQNCDISRLCGGATCKTAISTKSGVLVGFADVITYPKIALIMSNGFSRVTGGKTHVSLYKANGLYNIAMRYSAHCLVITV
jgi:hypothetical protein